MNEEKKTSRFESVARGFLSEHGDCGELEPHFESAATTLTALLERVDKTARSAPYVHHDLERMRREVVRSDLERGGTRISVLRKKATGSVLWVSDREPLGDPKGDEELVTAIIEPRCDERTSEIARGPGEDRHCRLYLDHDDRHEALRPDGTIYTWSVHRDEKAADLVYWPDGYIRDGVLAICPACKEVKEGTVGWHLQHERSCNWKPAGTWFEERLKNEIANAMERYVEAVPVTLAVAKRSLDAIWGGQWTVSNAAENQTCAYGCHEHDYEDHKAHEKHCEFLSLWRDLSSIRTQTGDTRIPEVRP